MKFRSEHLAIMKYALRWTLLIVPAAIAIGSSVALFLWLLHWATQFRFQHTWLLFLLPVAGLLIHLLYTTIGKSSEKGNNLIITQINDGGDGIPRAMAPIILITTVLTHLFGGSAGREGTAVQMGGGIADMFRKWFRLDEADAKIMLTAGIAGGFGAVFGTPLTGAVFALEVLVLGRMRYNALLPALIASIVGDLTVSAWGLHHTAYHINVAAQSDYSYARYFAIDLLLLLKVIAASVVFGLVSWLFIASLNGVKAFFGRFFTHQWMVPVLGGLTIIALSFALGKPDYLGLGVEAEYPGAVTVSSAFEAGGADAWSWLWKLIYTSITLGSGFKGGEVTPLFYIGATLGNTLSAILNAPVSLFAALGFIAVFSGATNTPLACTIMGVELFGSQYTLFFAVACFTAYLFSGTAGIYSAQKKPVAGRHHFME
ncbi:voltage-gated chloride channel family protein [Pedobacter deserti]|uniref:voltage-gated chloride channel family protein n=1 Tax=Pedobacter deserti TaxID=2817382 RepID=UPI00210C576E|nr:voltage-gated chloride channel family protein [Pedobacter sp. SYSU D00382]